MPAGMLFVYGEAVGLRLIGRLLTGRMNEG